MYDGIYKGSVILVESKTEIGVTPTRERVRVFFGLCPASLTLFVHITPASEDAQPCDGEHPDCWYELQGGLTGWTDGMGVMTIRVGAPALSTSKNPIFPLAVNPHRGVWRAYLQQRRQEETGDATDHRLYV